eukprot:2952649-Pyramimonas_sp.AAC.1
MSYVDYNAGAGRSVRMRITAASRWSVSGELLEICQEEGTPASAALPTAVERRQLATASEAAAGSPG